MKVIEGDFIHGIGEMDAGCTDIGHVHVHRQRFYLIKLVISKAAKITGKALYTAIICQVQGPPLPVRDNSDVLVSFLEADFIHGANFQPCENKGFEQQSVATTWSCLGNRQSLATVIRAVNAGYIRLNQGGELTGIEMTPFTTSVIMYGAGFTAGWTGQLCVLSNADNDRH